MLTVPQLKCRHLKEFARLLKKSRQKEDVIQQQRREYFIEDSRRHVIANLANTIGKKDDTHQCLKSSVCKNLSNQSGFPTQAQVVICGAGVVANSVAYHLIQYGWNDIVVVDQGSICSGTSHFGSGTLGLFKPIAEKNIILSSMKLYRQLEESGHNIGLKQCGSLNLAQTKDRVVFLQRRMSCNLPAGLQCQLVGVNELKRLHPFLNTDGLEGAVWVPEDAVCDPQAICFALAKLSMDGGAKYFEHCAVDKILTKNGRVNAVITSLGTIKCEYFVNCAGMWARDTGLQCVPKVRVPAYPVQLFYVKSGDLPGMPAPNSLPYIRDYDSQIYVRQYENGFMVGGFEKNAKAAFVDHLQVPRDWKSKLEQDWNHFKPLWENAIDRVPILKQAKDPVLTNSPDNFTPDGKWILGETPEVTNYFVAVGMNGNSLQGAGGIGKAVAEWMIEGVPTQELLPFEVQRFIDLHNNRQYLQQRVVEIVGRHYAVRHPSQCEYKTGRKLRCSPLYSVLETRGAVFGVRMGYERPLYFDTTYKHEPGKPLPQMVEGTYYKPKFFDFIRAEFTACREGVGLIDMSSFSKIEIKSQESDTVVDYLQKLCSNDVNIPVGGISHTGMQNDRGGYENDCIMVRLSENSYFMVSPTSQQTRIYEWMRRNLPSGSSITLSDVTSMYTVINVVGPKARALISELSKTDFNLQSFTYKKVNIGYASDVMVMAYTHTGDPGYCLYMPSEYALHVYDRLMTVGFDYGAKDVGCITQRYMRIEKFIPMWAEDLTSLTTPLEAGSGYRVKLDKDYFIGQFALQRQKAKGVMQRLLMFQLEDLDPDKDIWPWGMEPIYRNDQFVGNITSAGYGFTTEKLVCLGFIRCAGKHDHEEIVSIGYIMAPNAVYTIDIAGRRFLAKPHITAPAPVVTPNTDESAQTYRPKVVTSLKA